MALHKLRGALASVATALTLIAAAGAWTALPAHAGITASGID